MDIKYNCIPPPTDGRKYGHNFLFNNGQSRVFFFCRRFWHHSEVDLWPIEHTIIWLGDCQLVWRFISLKVPYRARYVGPKDPAVCQNNNVNGLYPLGQSEPKAKKNKKKKKTLRSHSYIKTTRACHISFSALFCWAEALVSQLFQSNRN